MIDYTPTTGDNDWKIVRSAATSSNFVMPQEFDRWLESVKAEERERIVDILKNENPEPMPAWDLYVRAIEEILEENA